jgi:hypothetical protein
VVFWHWHACRIHCVDRRFGWNQFSSQNRLQFAPSKLKMMHGGRAMDNLSELAIIGVACAGVMFFVSALVF